MAGKFIELKQAAEQLGITAERLLEMRDAGDIHGYRDGSSWKFKTAEIERIADTLNPETPDFASDDDLANLLDVSDASAGADGSSIQLADDGKEGEGSTTAIGKDEPVEEDSDLKLVEDAGSAKSDAGLSDFDLKLDDSEDLSDELVLSDDLDFESDDDVKLSDGDLALGDDDAAADDSSGSAVKVGGSDSDVGAADSDLLLGEDSLGSSGALELPEDEEMISLDDELVASPDDATQLQQDEEFLLSPSGEMFGDESSDSGSQVIALDDSGAFEGDSDVVALDSDEPILVPDESDGLAVQLEPMDGAVAVEGSALPVGAGDAPEAPYSVWNLLGLLFVVLLLSVTGMLMADVVRNMWSWNGDPVAGGLANTIIEALGIK